MRGGVADFSEPAGEEGTALARGLLRRVREQGPETAAREECARRRCSRTRFSADLPSFLSADHGPVLELGSGFGDDTARLVERGCDVIALAPTRAEAALTALRVPAGERLRVGVVPDLRRLPLADGSVGGVLFEMDSVEGFSLRRADLDAVAREWRRVLAPDGLVCVGVPHRLRRVFDFGRHLAARLRPGFEPSLNRLVKRGRPGSGTGFGLGAARAACAGAGLAESSGFAPLPSEDTIEVLLPSRDSRVVRYLFGQLLRRNSRGMQLALGLVDVCARLGVFHRAVPYYFATFSAASARKPTTISPQNTSSR